MFLLCSSVPLEGSPLLTCDPTERGRLDNAGILKSLAVIVLEHWKLWVKYKIVECSSMKPISLPTVVCFKIEI
jgi:hypothetical protein